MAHSRKKTSNALKVRRASLEVQCIPVAAVHNNTGSVRV